MCTCASCDYTDRFHGWKTEGGRLVPDPDRGGFERWPRGEPAGKRASESAYASHVRHSFFGIRKRAELPEFYNVPAGMTRAEVQAVLRRSFAPVEPPTLIDIARKMRERERFERKETLEWAKQLRAA